MTAVPPRGLEERLGDTRKRLKNDVDLRVASAGGPGGAHLIPLSFLWDGTALLVSTPRGSVTGRNLLADGRVRVGLGPTRSRSRPGSTRANSTSPTSTSAYGPGASRPGGRSTSRPGAR